MSKDESHGAHLSLLEKSRDARSQEKMNMKCIHGFLSSMTALLK